jgi:hypothetical protein
VAVVLALIGVGGSSDMLVYACLCTNAAFRCDGDRLFVYSWCI